MSATTENPIIFYDVGNSSRQSWSGNCYKTRLTLNFKGLPYRVRFVKFHEIESTLKALGVAPSSDGDVRYTLPVIADPSSDPNQKPTYIMDSFKIAIYLDNRYPAPTYPIVMPINTRALQKVFIDHFFVPSIHIPMSVRLILPTGVQTLLEPEEREYVFERFGANTFDPPAEDELSQVLEQTRKKWDELGQVIDLVGTSDGNPSSFITGEDWTFVDFAVVGIIHQLYRAEGGQSRVWKELMGWQDGRWARLWQEALELEKRAIEI